MSGKFSLFSKNKGTLTSASHLMIENENIVYVYDKKKDPLKIPISKVTRIIVGKHEEQPESAQKFRSVLLMSIELYKGTHHDFRQYHFLQRTTRHQSVFNFVKDLQKALTSMHKQLALNDDEVYRTMGEIENSGQDGAGHASIAVLWKDFPNAFINNLTIDKIGREEVAKIIEANRV